LCAKVAAIGGATCEYYQQIAARAGWTIACAVIVDDCGASSGNAMAGCSWPGGGLRGAALLQIIVYLNESPAHVVPTQTQPYAGALMAGASLACPPDISPLQCILDRVVHAHIRITYQTIGD
jgi:hypothetical protein